MQKVTLTTANGGLRTSRPTIGDATQGVPLRKQSNNDDGFQDYGQNNVWLHFEANVTGAAVGSIAFLKVWGYSPWVNDWLPVGPGTDADRGKLNGPGFTLGEILTTDDRIYLACPIEGLGSFTRVTIEMGTEANIVASSETAVLVKARGEQGS